MEPSERITACIPRLRRYARALVGDRAAADDLIQDTLERAWSKFSQFRDGSDLRAWLFSIMHNEHINQIRKRRDTMSFDDDAHDVSVPATQSDGLEIRDLDRALQTLPVEQREVLLLIVIEEMSYEEVSVALGIPTGTVMSRLSRARERVRAYMSGTPLITKLQVVK